jgi:hypothetical protein
MSVLIVLTQAFRPPPTLCPGNPCLRSAIGSKIVMSGSNDDLDMEALAARIKEVENAPDPEDVRLIVLDSMVPGQRLKLDAVPDAFLCSLQEAVDANQPVVMVGRERLRLHSHGVICQVEMEEYLGDAAPWSNVADAGSSESSGGKPPMSVVLTGDELVEITSVGPDEGSRWLGRAGKARRMQLDPASAPEERPTDDLIARCEELEELMIRWLKLVRKTGRERSPGQLDGILLDLGPLPEVDRPSARALWIAGLINPLPALGVALEIRPAVLMAATAQLRVGFALFGIKDSIERLEQSGSPF